MPEFPANMQENKNIFTYMLDFSPYLIDYYNKLTGRTSRIKQEGTQRNPDGSETPLWVVEVSAADPKLAMMNDVCALFICRQLDKYYNKEVYMGNLNGDEIVDIACDAIESTFAEVYLHSHEYEVKNPARLLTEEENMLNSLYIYLTNTKDGGAREWGGKIITIRQNDNLGAQKTDGGNILDALGQKLGGKNKE